MSWSTSQGQCRHSRGAVVTSLASRLCGKKDRSTHSYDDGGLCGQLVRDVGVHLDFGGVAAPVRHLLQRGTEACGRGEGEPE